MRLLVRIASTLLLLLLVGTLAGYLLLLRISSDLPDYQQLANYEHPVVTRVLAGDGRLLAEYAIEKRVFVPIRAIPAPRDRRLLWRPRTRPSTSIRASMCPASPAAIASI